MLAIALAAAVGLTASAGAHEITVKGVVAAVEASRVQVKTGEEKKGQAPQWYAIDAKTKIQRGTAVVTIAQAKIKTGERVVLIVDHEANGTMRTLEIRLAAE